MAEADHLQCISAVQVGVALGEMDVQILNGIVVIHIHGDSEVHAADGIYQGFKAPQVHQDRVIHGNPQLLGDHVGKHFHAAGIICGVDLVAFATPDRFGVPGDADTVNIVVDGVHRQQNVGVAAAVAIVHTGDQNGVEVRLPLQVRAQDLLVLRLG